MERFESDYTLTLYLQMWKTTRKSSILGNLSKGSAGGKNLHSSPEGELHLGDSLRQGVAYPVCAHY